MNRILVGMAALALAGVYGASADILEMEDGRRIRGELVSVNRGQVIFDEARPGSSPPRRLRVTTDEVTRIVLRETDVEDDADLDPMDDGPFGPARDDARGGRDDARRDDADIDDGPFGRNRDRDVGADREIERPDVDDRGLSSRDRLITVPARQAWTDTGIDVKTGDVVRFAAEGTVLRGPGQEDGPAGEMNSPMNDRRPVPARPAGALIGRIGTSPSDVFFIGDDRGGFRVRTSGRLHLGVNDHYYADNSGSFEVRVSH
jgi:PA-IL-like protein